MDILKKDGYTMPTPSQSVLYKALYKGAETLPKLFKDCLSNYEWYLHYDGKHLEGEKQVVVLKNSMHEIRLVVLSLGNGIADTIYGDLMAILTMYEELEAINIIM